MKFGKVYPVGGSVKGNVWEKVYETTLTGAATSVTISDLLGDTDEEYQLTTRIVNGYNGGLNTRCRPNNSSTANTYGWQYILGANTTVSAGRSTTGDFIALNSNEALNDISLGKTYLYAKSGYIRTAINSQARGIATTTVTGVALFGDVWSNTADQLTSLVLYADQADGLGTGSYIALYRKIER